VLQLGTFTPNQKYTLFAFTVGNLLGTFEELPDGVEFIAAGGPYESITTTRPPASMAALAPASSR